MAFTKVSSLTTLYRFFLEVKRDIEAYDKTAEVRALDFVTKNMTTTRDPRSSGTHQYMGETADGVTVRGAVDINVYDRRTGKPHRREWYLLNRFAKPKAIEYGLAYTFPYSPTVWLSSHSGDSLHLHADVGTLGTDYGNSYEPFRSGRGGYYRQAHAGRPKRLPPPPGGTKPTTTTGPTRYPLPAGVDFARDDGTWRTRSGVNAADRQHIKRIQAVVGVTQDGRYGPNTAAAVRRWQTSKKLRADDRVGPTTWKAMGL